jgi:hypothetical protein
MFPQVLQTQFGSTLWRWHLATALWGLENVGLSCLLLACYEGEITLLSYPHIGVRFCGYYSYCPRVTSAILSWQLPGIPWGVRLWLSLPQGKVGLVPPTFCLIDCHLFDIRYLVTLLCFSMLFLSLALLYIVPFFLTKVIPWTWGKLLLLNHLAPPPPLLIWGCILKAKSHACHMSIYSVLTEKGIDRIKLIHLARVCYSTDNLTNKDLHMTLS